MLIATKHVNIIVIFVIPVSSIGYALITCCGEDEMKTRMKRRLLSRLEQSWEDDM